MEAPVVVFEHIFHMSKQIFSSVVDCSIPRDEGSNPVRPTKASFSAILLTVANGALSEGHILFNFRESSIYSADVLCHFLRGILFKSPAQGAR